MSSEIDVKKMTRPEKLWLVETVWRDLSGEDAEIPSPAWHQTVLQDTELLASEGKATFSNWAEAKARLHKAVSNL
jgi:hypothetical protein